MTGLPSSFGSPGFSLVAMPGLFLAPGCAFPQGKLPFLCVQWVSSASNAAPFHLTVEAAEESCYGAGAKQLQCYPGALLKHSCSPKRLSTVAKGTHSSVLVVPQEQTKQAGAALSQSLQIHSKT